MDINTKRWMEQLAPYIQEQPITRIFIPGSHDSAAYSLEHKFGKNQNVTSKVNVLKYLLFGFVVTQVAHRWAKTQDRSILQQLEDGVRYLDLRVIYRDSKKDFYTVHGLYCPILDAILSQIETFLSENPKEIIVIQVGDLRYMPNGDDDHLTLIKKLKHKFGNRLSSKSMPLDTPIKKLWEQNKQVILIYNDHKIAQKHDFIFSKDTIDSYWANSDNLLDLKKRLDDNLNKRIQRLDQLFVIQSQMTANTNIIFTSLKPFSKKYKSLKKMADSVEERLSLWLKEWYQHGPCIIMLDFTSKHTSEQIIRLNLPHQP